MLIGVGRFSGMGGHKVSGSFALRRGRAGVILETSADFYFDGSLEPGWALHPSVPCERTDPRLHAMANATRFGDLPRDVTEIAGRHTAVVPAHIRIEEYNSVFLWCYGAPYLLGIGPIER